MMHGGGTKSGPDHQVDSTLKEAFKNARISVPLGSPLRGPDGIPTIKRPKSQAECLIRKHGAREIDREELGLSS